MDFSTVFGLVSTALELGLICSLTALALHLSYSMLNVCDLSTDGCFTLGAAVGIIVNTALYSVNIAVMKGGSLINLNKTETVFTKVRALLENTPLASSYKLITILTAVILSVTVLTLFLKTRLGISIRCTGDNPDMVRSSSINLVFTTIIGLCAANAFTALSGCLMAQVQKSVDINLGTGMLTIALASLLIGRTIMGKGGLLTRAIGVVLGSFIFRLVYTVALRLDMPAFMLKAVSSVIVVLAISLPYLKSRKDIIMRRFHHYRAKGGLKNAENQ